jgi:hypothetical protein
MQIARPMVSIWGSCAGKVNTRGRGGQGLRQRRDMKDRCCRHRLSISSTLLHSSFSEPWRRAGRSASGVHERREHGEQGWNGARLVFCGASGWNVAVKAWSASRRRDSAGLKPKEALSSRFSHNNAHAAGGTRIERP